MSENRYHVEALAAALRSVGRRVYDFGIHYGYCPYTRGCYVDLSGPLLNPSPARCSDTCARANAALAEAERWLESEGAALPVTARPTAPRHRRT